MFNAIEPKTVEAYCALVCGMASYGQVEGAYEYFNQMTAKGFIPNVQTYNSILKAAGSLKESAELKWNFIQVLKPPIPYLNSSDPQIWSFSIGNVDEYGHS